MVLPRAALALKVGSTQHLFCRLMLYAGASSKPAVFSYQAVADASVPRAGPAQRDMEDYRGRKKDAGA